MSIETSHEQNSKNSVLGEHLLHKYGSNELKLLLFKVGNTNYAINIAKVCQSISCGNLKVHPLGAIQKKHFIGEIVILDETIPVVDLIGYLEVESDDDFQNRMAIVTEFDNQKIAFISNLVTQNITVSWNDVIPVEPPINLDSTITGYVVINEEIIQLLDFEKVRDEVLGQRYDLQTISANTGDQKNILYAEDSACVRKIVSSGLRKKNYTVTECENGLIAWEAFVENPSKYKLVISDIEMPLKDGTKLVSDIRAHKDGKDIPIVLMSSMSMQQNIQQYLDIGANNFISKDDMHKLDKVITEYLS